MKVLLIHDIGTATGGAELQMLSLRQGLRDLGHDVRLFSSQATPVRNSELLADYSCFGTNSLLQVCSQTINPSAYWRLKAVLKKFQPDVVHVRMFMWQLSPLILPLLKDIPCIYQTAVYKAICPIGTKVLPDGSECQYNPGKACLSNGCLTPQTWAVLMVQQKLWEYWRDAFDVVVALSKGMKSKLKEAGIKPVEVVYNGVPVRKQNSPLKETPTVVYAGRLVPEKGVDVLLQAFAKARATIAESRLLIAGDGVEKANLQTLSHDLGIADAVTWLGYLPQEAMEQHFEGSWVQVVPSQWAEPFGNVTTEAMMRGTAVIASAVGAQPEIVANGKTGFLVNPEDVSALASNLTSLLSNRQLATTMGQKGRDRALNKFSEDKRNQKFLRIYKQLQAKYQPSNSLIQKLKMEA
ncbi:Group 1 glycosyl transferase [Hyella patelloides LEGE 07179]|uniref:Group 1 glycosyl transferase n=1 Tax=Hyella patelloides LEGE 07179 TaxID=945734 RepID=A0A563VWK5_9CYAN|nr:glycosyltransferase family 4 protein [Hyella patelloides]VEP15838.1 Group 1 glycosyl transferase [Hyella patelloides LEGE 07179]